MTMGSPLPKFLPTDKDKIHLAEVLDRSLSEVFAFDAQNFKFLYVNQGAISNLGYDAFELQEMTPWDLKPLNIREFKSLIEPLAKDEIKKLEFETKHIRKNGSSYDVQVSLEKGSFGAKDCFYANILDISTRKNLLNDLLMSSRLNTIGEIAQSVGHEINNPLMIIEMALNKLEDSLMDNQHSSEGAINKNLGRIKNASKRIKKIAGSLRSFSTIENFSKSVCNLKEMVQKAVDSYAEVLRVENIQLITDFKEDDFYLYCHPDAFNEIIIHLLSNAKDALRSNSRPKIITIEVHSLEDKISLSVTDNGPGIESEVSQTLFQTFVTTKANSGGAGLGLSIARHIACEFGGSLQYDASSSGGSCFTLEFPKAQKSPLQQKQNPKSNQCEAKVALIEDEELLSEMIIDYLEDCGFETKAYRNVDDFLEALNETQFDLIVSDINLPKKTGFDLMKHMAENAPQILQRLLFITGGSLEVLDPEGKDLITKNNIKILFKPFVLSQLHELIDDVLASVDRK